MKADFLVDAPEFVRALQNDMAKARTKIYIQAMTFEGDAAGRQITDVLASSSAKDRRILVDSYIKVMLSDRLLFSPKNWRDPNLRQEAKETEQLFKGLPALGVQVRYMNPLGFFLTKYPIRNHKKIVLIDDSICYLGGINFSDHNFGWHDLMLRIESPALHAVLLRDFLSTWDGQNISAIERVNDFTCYFLDGKTNQALFQPILQRIAAAGKSIFIETPYFSFPFYEPLRQARRRGVQVDLVAPEKNNKLFMHKYNLWEAQRSDIRLWLLRDRMTHLKAMLIDDCFLIIGSSNFDFVSFRSQQELLVTIENPRIIAEFRKRIIEPDLAHSLLWQGQVPHRRGLLRYAALQAVGNLWVGLSRLCS